MWVFRGRSPILWKISRLWNHELRWSVLIWLHFAHFSHSYCYCVCLSVYKISFDVMGTDRFCDKEELIRFLFESLSMLLKWLGSSHSILHQHCNKICFSCDLDFWPVVLAFDVDLDSVIANQLAAHISQSHTVQKLPSACRHMHASLQKIITTAELNEYDIFCQWSPGGASIFCLDHVHC